jgi:hypothetical protein
MGMTKYNWSCIQCKPNELKKVQGHLQGSQLEIATMIWLSTREPDLIKNDLTWHLPTG